MREVSCRALSGYKAYAHRRGADWRTLVEGLTATHEQLDDPSEWFDWEDFARILTRLEATCGPGACMEAGRVAIEGGSTTPLQRIAGVTMNLVSTYRFGVVWLTPLLFRQLDTQFETLDSGRLRVGFSVPDHFVENRHFFEALEGGLESLPQILALPPATVVSTLQPRGGVYDIWLPPRRQGLLGRFRARFAGAALAELERQVQVVNEIDRERMRVEAALRERERMLSNLLENLSGLVYRCRASDQVFEYASPQSLLVTGYRPQELVANEWSLLALIDPADRERVRVESERALSEGHPCTLEYRLRHRDGQLRSVLDVSRSVDVAGRPTVLEGFITDITHQKRFEQEFDRVQRLESVGRLAGGVAHDFNNLLTVISGLVDLSRTKLPADSEVSGYNEQIGAAADRAAGLTRQLLACARRQPVAPRIVDLHTLVGGMQKLLQRTLMEDVTLRYLPGIGLWNVCVDPGQFEQVLLNLALNARDAMPEGGTLSIETGNLVLEHHSAELPGMDPGDYVLLRVSDTGTGMDEETCLHVFEPFFTTKEVGRGTGMGLASAHGIVSQAGGHIYLKSTPGQGSQFSIYLPRAAGEATQPVPPRLQGGKGKGEHILLVEDHETLLTMFADTLEQHGYVVRRANSGPRALKYVREHGWPVDLLVTDVIMPKMGGVSLSRELRARFPGLPTLFMSGYTESGRVGDEEPGTVTAFLAKPFTPAVLAAEVRALLDRARAQAQAASRTLGRG